MLLNQLKSFTIKKRQTFRLIFFLFFDAFFISLSVLFAFIVRFEGQIPSQYFLNIQGIIVLCFLIVLPIFYFLNLYRFSWQYVSTEDLISLAKAVVLSFLVLTSVFFVLKENPIFSGFPRSTLFITCFFIFIFSGGFRFSKRIFSQIFVKQTRKDKEKTLIVGAGDAGEQILRSILGFKEGPYQIIGFIDDNLAKQGALIHGLKVLGKINDIPEIVKKNKVESLIIAMPSADSESIHQAVEKGRQAGLQKIKTVPGVEEIINGKIFIGQLRQVKMENLLGRESLSLDKKLIEEFIKDKIVLVTGGAGSIGSELCRQIIKFNPFLLMILDQDETGIFNISEELKNDFPQKKLASFVVDIKDKEKITQIFEKFSPEVIFHAAAYKHVPLMEESPDIAVKNNIFGTKILAETALKNNTKKFVFISTDKAVNPSSVMGATKRIGEMVCQNLNQENKTKFISVRFGNVLDSRGSVIPVFREKIKKRQAIEVTHPEMKRFFMVTSEACLLVLQAGAMGQGKEVFVLDMGNPIKIIDLAKEMIRLSGLEPDKDVPIVFSQPRPGEKLFEEILTAEEGTVATKHQKIFMAKLSENDSEKLNSSLIQLEKFSKQGNKEEIIKIFKEIIPYYQKLNLKS